MNAKESGIRSDARDRVMLTFLAVMVILVLTFGAIFWSLMRYGTPIAGTAVVAGCGLLGFGSIQLRRASGVSAWARVTARVIERSVGEIIEPSDLGGYIKYFPVIRYVYVLPSGTFECGRYSPSPSDFQDINREKAQKIIDPYSLGLRVEAWVNPDDPRDAVLHSGLSAHRRSHYWACAVGGILIAAVAEFSAAIDLLR